MHPSCLAGIHRHLTLCKKQPSHPQSTHQLPRRHLHVAEEGLHLRRPLLKQRKEIVLRGCSAGGNSLYAFECPIWLYPSLDGGVGGKSILTFLPTLFRTAPQTLVHQGCTLNPSSHLHQILDVRHPPRVRHIGRRLALVDVVDALHPALNLWGGNTEEKRNIVWGRSYQILTCS